MVTLTLILIAVLFGIGIFTLMCKVLRYFLGISKLQATLERIERNTRGD